jgi:hypothetical protein
MNLITGDTWFKMNYEQFKARYLRPLQAKFGIIAAGVDDKAAPLPAMVNHGAWIVICPNCRGAEYAFENGYFFCCSCKNSRNGHKYRNVIFPRDRAPIEALLIKRPLDNRNWAPGESLAQLDYENKLHARELLTGVEEA